MKIDLLYTSVKINRKNICALARIALIFVISACGRSDKISAQMNQSMLLSKYLESIASNRIQLRTRAAYFHVLREIDAFSYVNVDDSAGSRFLNLLNVATGKELRHVALNDGMYFTDYDIQNDTLYFIDPTNGSIHYMDLITLTTGELSTFTYAYNIQLIDSFAVVTGLTGAFVIKSGKKWSIIGQIDQKNRLGIQSNLKVGYRYPFIYLSTIEDTSSSGYQIQCYDLLKMLRPVWSTKSEFSQSIKLCIDDSNIYSLVLSDNKNASILYEIDKNNGKIIREINDDKDEKNRIVNFEIINNTIIYSTFYSINWIDLGSGKIIRTINFNQVDNIAIFAGHLLIEETISKGDDKIIHIMNVATGNEEARFVVDQMPISIGRYLWYDNFLYW